MLKGALFGTDKPKPDRGMRIAKNDRLWLDRLELELDDGELVVLNLDHYSFCGGSHKSWRDSGKAEPDRNRDG